MTAALASPALRFAVREDGSLEVLGPWLPLIAVPLDLLDRGRGVAYDARDGVLSFRCVNGSARYALFGSVRPDEFVGHLLDSTMGWPCS